MLDADLQDPPELIPDMVARWSQGAEVVYAVRKDRSGETAFKLATASWFYRLFNKLAQVDLEPNSGDFRLLDRRALDALLTMTERSRFLRGMTVWVGFNQTAVSYQRDARHAGETKYTLSKMVKFALDALSSFSHFPLQVATILGFLFSFIGADAGTDWLSPCAALSDAGFIRTDRALERRSLNERWDVLGRDPLPFETAHPGLFAVGDVRSGSVKRVAAAVGEGSAVIPSVHEHLSFRH